MVSSKNGDGTGSKKRNSRPMEPIAEGELGKPIYSSPE